MHACSSLQKLDCCFDGDRCDVWVMPVSPPLRIRRRQRRDGAARLRLETARNATPARTADTAQKAGVSSAYGKLPISFEANVGQADARVKFSARGKGYRVFLTGDEAVISLRSAAPRPGLKTWWRGVARRDSGGCGEHKSCGSPLEVGGGEHARPRLPEQRNCRG